MVRKYVKKERTGKWKKEKDDNPAYVGIEMDIKSRMNEGFFFKKKKKKKKKALLFTRDIQK